MNKQQRNTLKFFEMLSRPGGATFRELRAVLDWKVFSIPHKAIALGLRLYAQEDPDGATRYFIAKGKRLVPLEKRVCLPIIYEMLTRPEGATHRELTAAVGWRMVPVKLNAERLKLSLTIKIEPDGKTWPYFGKPLMAPPMTAEEWIARELAAQQR